MDFRFKGTDHHYPATLGEITLGQRIKFHEQYGITLDKQAEEIKAMPEGADRDIEEDMWGFEAAVQTFSFFTGIDLEVVKREISLQQVSNVYNASLALLMEQESEIVLQAFYEWKGKKWTIAPPELSPASEMVFNEFLAAKESLRQLQSLGKGMWESLPYLCAVYLRPDGEAFDETIFDERREMMHELPLDIALAVGFFLESTLTIYNETSQSSKREEGEKVLT